MAPSDRERQAKREHVSGIIHVGPLESPAGLECLVDALAMVRDRGRVFQAVVVGEGRGEPVLRAAVRRRKLEANVSVVGDRAVWVEAVAGADVYVLPNRETSLSLAPLWAMARGMPVIASRDQIADWFVEGETVWGFAPGDAPGLADRLLAVGLEGDAAEALGQRARAYVRRVHRVDRLAGELRGFYETLAFPTRSVAFPATRSAGQTG